MKEQILEISKKLELGEITTEHAQYLLLCLFGVSGSDSNKCEECGKELESGTVFCSADCRIHYYR